MGKWKCLCCSKVLEGESFMDLVTTYTNNNERPPAWENITLAEEETDLENKLLPSLHSLSGDQQTLIVWTSSGMDLDQAIPTLQEITPGLPYS
jgi:hypothetical protein